MVIGAWYLKMRELIIRRVEKYRPDTLDDVSGHQDILATINKFIDTNVRSLPPSPAQGRLILCSDYHIFSSTGPRVQARHRPYWHWHVEYMGIGTCARWC